MYFSFRIQYAKAIRWKPPIDLHSAMFPNGYLNATSYGPCCPQPEGDLYIRAQDEQCLYLNIFQPIVSANHSAFPVFFYIHGGAHNHGCSSEANPVVFNGTNMIAHAPTDQPVIVITIDYRLGVLADMYLEELIEEDPEWPTAGNYMYLDMLSALRWVKKNIRDYGGDPNEIRIFGESAGGLSVVDLGATRGSANLYLTAISQSGLGSPGSISSYHSARNALDYSNSLVKRINCTNEDKRKVLECLRNASFLSLLKVYTDRYTRPILDNYFFPLYPPLAILNGTYNNNISLIMGHNDFEQPICFEHPNMNFTEALTTIIEAVGSKWAPFVADYYHLHNCSSDHDANDSRCCNIVRLIMMDKTFECDIRRIFAAFYTKYGPQYAANKLFSYHLNCYPTCPAVSNEGICRHGSELPFVFGTVSTVTSHQLPNCTWNNQTREFSNDIITQWMNIASTGKPLLSWPSYNPAEPKYFHITPDQGFTSEPWMRNCSFYDTIEDEAVMETFGKNIYSKIERNI